MKKLWILLAFLGMFGYTAAWADAWSDAQMPGYAPQPSQSFAEPPTIVRPVGPGMQQYGPINGNPQGQINQAPNGGPVIIQPYSGGPPTLCTAMAHGSVICQ